MDFQRRVDQSQYSQLMPLYPARTLAFHVFIKGVQAGSIAGLALTPVIKLVRGQPLMGVWRTYVPVGAVGGTLLSLGLLAAKEYKGELSVAGVDDRAFRIVHSQSQQRVDRGSEIGALAGAAAGAVLGRHGFRSVLASSFTGVAIGVGCAAYMNHMKM